MHLYLEDQPRQEVVEHRPEQEVHIMLIVLVMVVGIVAELSSSTKGAIHVSRKKHFKVAL